MHLAEVCISVLWSFMILCFRTVMATVMLQLCYGYANAHPFLNLRTLCDKSFHVEAILLLMFWRIFNIFHHLWKPQIFVFILGISKTLLCFLLVLSFTQCSSVRCIILKNLVSRNFDIFGKAAVNPNHIIY
jgi:hypothetical protein